MNLRKPLIMRFALPRESLSETTSPTSSLSSESVALLQSLSDQWERPWIRLFQSLRSSSTESRVCTKSITLEHRLLRMFSSLLKRVLILSDSRELFSSSQSL